MFLTEDWVDVTTFLGSNPGFEADGTSGIFVVEARNKPLNTDEAFIFFPSAKSDYTAPSSPMKVWARAVSGSARIKIGKVADSKDADLTSIVVENASNDEVLEGLTPDFDGATLAYTLAVVNAVAQITVKPGKYEYATVAYNNSGNNAIADADATKDGQQVNLTTGSNVIKIVVTAEDETTTKTYTLTVTRAS